MGDVLWSLADLGFDAQWGCLSAADVGAPHRRNRVWILAWLRDLPDAERDRVRVVAERYQRSERSEPATERGNAEPRDNGAAG
jgi:DNA (cytosine-5)-methyltransferase 1